jgi:altronate dehydratase
MASAQEITGVVLLGPDDNVVVTREDTIAGGLVEIDGKTWPCEGVIPLGHKLARRDIKKGEKILKYGAPIGSATRDIAAGSHVHVHNVKSDYLHSHTTRPDEEVGV